MTVSGQDDATVAAEFEGDHRSRWVDLGGPVHYLDFGGPPSGPVMVAVHGLGGSALNWSALAPLLTGRYRVLAPDLAGHGLTESRGRATTVKANRLLLHRFIETIPGSPVILVGNSMGGMISLLEAAAAPGAVAGLVLVSAALPFVPVLPDPVVAATFATYGLPLLGRRLMARSRALPAETQVAMALALCCVDPARIPSGVVAEHVEMARRRLRFPHVEKDFLAAGRSVVATAGFGRGLGYRRAVRTIRAPALLLHGEDDRLVPVAASRAVAKRNPSWALVVLPGVGHLPQLEVPQQTADAIIEWLHDGGREAVGPATHPPA